jgi:hypothetical protein
MLLLLLLCCCCSSCVVAVVLVLVVVVIWTIMWQSHLPILTGLFNHSCHISPKDPGQCTGSSAPSLVVDRIYCCRHVLDEDLFRSVSNVSEYFKVRSLAYVREI